MLSLRERGADIKRLKKFEWRAGMLLDNGYRLQDSDLPAGSDTAGWYPNPDDPATRGILIDILRAELNCAHLSVVYDSDTQLWKLWFDYGDEGDRWVEVFGFMDEGYWNESDVIWDALSIAENKTDGLY
jgi:hypothetical protein